VNTTTLYLLPEPAATLVLRNRQARCTMCSRETASSLGLAFFAYQGPGSPAEKICRCGYHERVHEGDRLNCKEYVSGGPKNHDSWYCGCRGWD
jgi:hypothetical protein